MIQMNMLMFIVKDILLYLYILLKIYKILCSCKLVLDQLPSCNPYIWPWSFIKILTKPYFSFWKNLLPYLKIGNSSLDISTILGLEFLNKLLPLILYSRLLLLNLIITKN